MQKRLVVTGLAVALVLAAAVAPAQAQVEPAPYITVHYDSIDPAKFVAYVENAKDWVEAFQGAKAGKEFYWRAYQHGFTFAWVGDMPNYGYMDDSEARDKMLDEKLGEGTMAELVTGANDAVVDHHTEIWKYQADMSYMPEGFDPSKMRAINVSTDRVRASMRKEFSELVKEAVAAMKKINAPVNWFAYSIPFGQGDYGFVTWGEDQAALHGGPDMGELFAEALGPDGAKDIFDRYYKCIASTENRDWRARTDLSYMTDEMMEETSKEEKAE